MSLARLEMPEVSLIAGRYRVVRSLGKGGNAEVWEVEDEATCARVALKQLTPEDAARPLVRDLFRREFNTLAQLAHPLIVRAFDYGVDGTPYYTMELISGASLRGAFAWQEVCSLLRDVASALSLVHSRRLVHRDVTHRNVYKTADGHAKLFDFGALAPMGPTSEVVGTPPFIPPEAIAEQRLDARSDLFSLGALAYFLLTERHAFPVRRLADLTEAWRRTVEVPSQFVPDVPKALDELIVSLLSLNPIARPQSAAEVFNRLTAIASLPMSEAPEVAQAYLTTPALVGRSDATRQFRQLLARSRKGKGSALVLEGSRGLGRSRLLSSFLLDAKLDGFVTLRAEPGAEGESFGLAKGLLRQLRLVEPKISADALRPFEELLFPLLGGASVAIDDSNENRSAAMVDALAAALAAVAEAKPMIVGVDDFERVDTHSKALLIRLAKATEKCALNLVVTLIQEASTDAHLLLRDLSSAVVLTLLSSSEVRQLMCSLFGEVAHLEAVSAWVHRLSAGNPRTALEAATHLVDAKIAHFEEGSWALPGSITDLELPASIDQALDAKIASLGPEARVLCQALALTSEEDPLQYDECGALIDGVSGARLDAAIAELVARSVVTSTPPSIAFAHEGLLHAARRSIPDAELADLHRRIAAAYHSSASPSPGLAACHAFSAGDLETAFAHAARAAHKRTSILTRGSAFLRTAEGTRAFERLFEWGLSTRKPWPDVLAIGQMLLLTAAVADTGLAHHREPILARLRLDSGLSDWEELPEIEDPFERVRTAVGRAFMRHESTPKTERGIAPLSAIEMLCGVVAGLTGIFARRFEPLEAVPLLALIEPFRPISPAVTVVADVVTIGVDAMLGRNVREPRLSLLERTSAPVPGLEEVPRVGMYFLNLYYHALDDAALGLPDAAELARPLMQTATYAPLAWQARVIAALFQGDVEGAETARRERDLSKLSRWSEVDAQLESGILYEAAAFDFLGDVLRMKRSLLSLGERLRMSPGMAGYHELHVGNYHRLRGEIPKALAAYERARALAPVAARHGEWAYIVLRYGRTLVDAGRGTQARELCASALVEADAHGVARWVRYFVEMTLALAEASLGFARKAAQRSERVVEQATSDKLSGIMFVTLCKDQSRVAELAHDDRLLERAIARLERLAAHAKYPAFAAKHAHLLRNAQGRGRFQVAPNPQKALGGSESTHTSLVAGVRTQIELCRGRSERARRALNILLRAAASDEGFLYLLDQNGIQLAASTTEHAPPRSLEKELAERVRSGAAEGDTTDETTQITSLRPVDPDAWFDVVEVISEANGRCVLAGLAAVKPRNGTLSPVPMNIRTALSDALIKAGDTSAIPWA